MAIYRGPGGSGDAVNDSSSETTLAVLARDAAIAAQAAAEAAQAAAETAETNAETAETNAETAETNAETAATNAASSASAASTSASNASSSASSASTSATNAASSASSASTSASSASTSATNAATSATNASNSASSASTSATSAASSASSASTSASTATTKASEASTSATNAASSASSAASSASTATTQAGLASTSATNAASSASAASTSASNAATSATNASNSASAAATSATNASNSASAANTSATNAASSASSSQAAADAALAALDSFDDRYLGQKSTAPTVDNDGNALVTGALYFDTVSNAMKVWDGSAWLSAYASLSGALLATNNLSDLSSASTARTNLGVAIGTNVQAWDADLDTWATKTAPTGVVVGTTDTQTLTNKTISGASNTLSNIGNSSLTNSSITIGGSAVSLGGTVGTLGVAYGGTGLTSLTAGYIPFGAGTSALGSSSSLFWDNTNTRLGIGTSSPSYKLDVRGSSPVLAVNDTGANLSQIFMQATNTGNYFGSSFTGAGAVQPLLFYVGSTKMTLDTSGNLGLGVTPSAWSGYTALQVNNSISLWTSTGSSVYLSNNVYTDGVGRKYVFNGYASEYQTGGGAHYWKTAASGTAGNAITFTQAMTLNASGNLCIGLTSSDTGERLRVATTSGNTALTVEATGVGPYIRLLDVGSSEWAVGIPDGVNALSFVSGRNSAGAGTERMRIDSSGNVGIGTSSPDAKLRVDLNGGGLVSKFVSNTGSTYITVGAASTYQTQFGYNISSEYGFIQPIAAAGVYDDLVICPSGGNLGLGVTPSAWNIGNSQKAFQVGPVGSLSSLSAATGNQQVNLANNTYDFSSSPTYITTDAATNYKQVGGKHIWYYAASGTAGTAITFTQAMTLESTGDLAIGVTSASGARLYVSGKALSAAFDNSTGVYTRWKYNGTNVGIIGTANQVLSGGSTTGFAIGTELAGELVFGTNNTERMRLGSDGGFMVGTTTSPGAGLISDSKGDVRSIPQNAQTAAYVLVVGDAGKHISITTGGVTCNASIFSAGQAVTIYNNSGSNQTITAGTNVTFRLAGTTTTGNRTLAQYGVATLLCVTGGATPTFVVSGAGVS